MGNNATNSTHCILAFVGMSGSGKSEAAKLMGEKGYEVIRLGDLTDELLKKDNLAINPQNEKSYREKIRQERGMDAYAVAAKPRIDKALEEKNVVILDGMYSWAEYLYFDSLYSNIIVTHVYARPEIRYARLSKRAVRPQTPQESHDRDVSEIEHLDKGGPIAIADYMIDNSEDSMETLKEKIDTLMIDLEGKIT